MEEKEKVERIKRLVIIMSEEVGIEEEVKQLLQEERIREEYFDNTVEGESHVGLQIQRNHRTKEL